MPHSSGGFHGGGFHGGGGGFHGGGFHGSNYHGTGHAVYHGHRFSRWAFYGATRYVYYRHGRPHYIYSDSEPSTADPKKAWLPTIILGLMLFIPAICTLVSGFHFPRKLSTNYDTKIVIDDEGQRLSEKDKAKITETFIFFREKTGITPALTTTGWVTSMFWPYSLEDYAYSDYVTKFKDEKHWLIVYQSKDNFEGMQGDETDNILTKAVTKKFNYAFHDYLVKDNTLTESLVKAFDDITPKIMDFSYSVDEDVGVPLGFWFTVTGVAFAFSVVRLVNTYRMKDAVKMPNDPKVKACPYCGCLYYSNTVTKCPKCGAAFNVREEPKHQPQQEEVKKEEDEYAIDPDQFKIDNDQF